MLNALNEFLTGWNLTLVGPVADTGHARVWKVTTARGETAALKLYRRADRGNETAGPPLLRSWRQRGAVSILAAAPAAVLMEWLDGPSLGDIARGGDPDDAVSLLAGTAGRLHRNPVKTTTGLQPLEAVFAPLFTCRFAADCPASLRQDMSRAISLGRHLLDTQNTQTPLHGDLHHDNVILNADRPRVIDAKGYIGDPAFELANALRHPKGLPELVRKPAQIETCLTQYARSMQVSRLRLSQWAAAKCALSIFWRSDRLVAQDAEADMLHLLLRQAGQ